VIHTYVFGQKLPEPKGNLGLLVPSPYELVRHPWRARQTQRSRSTGIDPGSLRGKGQPPRFPIRESFIDVDTHVVCSMDIDISPDSSLEVESTRRARNLKIRKESLESVSQRVPLPSAAGVTLRSGFFQPPWRADRYRQKAAHTVVSNPEPASSTTSYQRYNCGG